MLIAAILWWLLTAGLAGNLSGGEPGIGGALHMAPATEEPLGGSGMQDSGGDGFEVIACEIQNPC